MEANPQPGGAELHQSVTVLRSFRVQEQPSLALALAPAPLPSLATAAAALTAPGAALLVH